MTHDERRLLILVTRILVNELAPGSKSAAEAAKLIHRIQRHASIQNAKREAELVATWAN